ncbi:uncharacterized protein B0H18DRAFT_965886 [Fomitopsis serialis]|uniref:uncharacterized protein n=1 Tax=Fomitopsis serialis TaxID=139415 RepID=UPI0020074FBD|nr:uncharacterized protein B0H18DRAFT_965886 [Neoantrodia serialis]KAH9938168.1 hypothetical protein B0H18DRAFT_965886 [Neoantrodia serialis]
MQAVAPATAKFQLAIPYVLGAVSPGLAALHASRARRLHPTDPTLRTTHCPACGAGYLDGGGEYRSVRSNGEQRRVSLKAETPPNRFLHISCGVCGHREELPIEQDGAPSFLPPRKRRKTVAPNAGTASTTNTDASKSGEDAHARTGPKPAGPRPVDSRESQTKAGPPRASTMLPILPESAAERKTGTTTSSPTASSNPARSKTRTKNSSGLQSLLARNREKQEQEKKATASGSGLSAFLQDLR